MSRRSLLVLALLAPLSALATVVLSMSMEEMATRAPLVLRGTVHRVDTQWDEAHAGLWTTSEVVVREVLKGPARTTVLVKQPGGTLNGFSQRVSGVASFTPGEDVVLFLEPAVDAPDAFVPVAMSAARVSLVQKGGQTIATRDLSGLTFASPGQRGLIRPVDAHEVLGFADAFLARLRAAVKGGAR
ncbi:MAG: hypothetical protein JNJ54_24550 [Myxococcaceae bacterium]|nr:hypothetical protein [Myxococcaceae bacterium]